MAMAGSFPGFLVGSAMVGGAAGFIAQSRYAAAEMVPAAVRGRTVGLMLFGSVIGAIGSAALTPTVRSLAESAGVDSIELSWLIGGIFLALGALLVGGFFRPIPPAAASPTAAPGTLEAERTRGEVFALPDVRLAMLSLVVGQGVMVMLMDLIPLHAERNGHDLPTLSLILSVHFVGMFAFAWLTGRLVDTRGPRAVSALGGVQILFGAAIASISASVAGLGLSLFFIGLGWNFCYVAGSTLLSQQLQAAERSRIQGTVDFLGYLAAALCVSGGGLLFGVLGFEAVAGVGMAAPLVLLMTLFAGRLGGRRQEASPGLST